MAPSSQSVIVTPAAVKQFADQLESSVRQLQIKGKKMRDATTAARAVWNDAKYDAFQKQLAGCMESLERFNKKGLKYSEFLHEKADLANRYLKRR